MPLPRCIWIAAESLDAALRYMRQRYDDFIITEARFLDMIPPALRLTTGLMATRARPAKEHRSQPAI